jgi:hypothetical protein
MAEISTIQSGIKHHTNDDLTKYALFMGGLNVTHDVLVNYDPLKTGYGRLFMIRKPVFLDNTIPSKLKKFKHILEYGNTSVTGINDVTVNTAQIQGGYTGKSFEIPTFAQDDTNAFTVNCYEFSGSPIREVIHTWVNGMSDLLTGLTHYNGDNIAKLQSNQTAEFIYVATDNTGEGVEYACLFANCFPKNIKNDHFNYTSGEHNFVEYNIEFSCTKYESIQINKVAKSLLDRYKLLANSLNFYSGVKSTDSSTLGAGTGYDIATGQMTASAASKNTKVPMTASELAGL